VHVELVAPDVDDLDRHDVREDERRHEQPGDRRDDTGARHQGSI
jgi:hypothetical protein